MMNNVHRFGWMPEEIYSKKGKTVDDGSLSKVLLYNIVWQARVYAGLSSIDTVNLVHYGSILNILEVFGSQGTSPRAPRLYQIFTNFIYFPNPIT